MEGSKLLINEPPIEIDVSLAREYGIRAAVVGAVILQEPEGIDKGSLIRSLSFLPRTTVVKCLKTLQAARVIVNYESNAFVIVNILKAKHLEGTGYGRLQCAWCLCSTVTLAFHHYPIAKADGGADTVGICNNCHSEYHYLLSQPIYRSSKYHAE